MVQYRFIGKLAAYLLLVSCTQVLACYLFPKLVLSNSYLVWVNRSATGHIVYAGDSSLMEMGPEPLSLPDMLAELRPTDPVLNVTLFGQDVRGIYCVLHGLLDRGQKPKAAVVAISLPLMFADWSPFLDAEENSLRQLAMHRPVLRCFTKPAAVFKVYEPVSGPVFELPEKTPSLEELVARAHKTPSHLRRGDFVHRPERAPEQLPYVEKTARLLAEHGIPAVLYISPISIERGERVFGEGQKEAAQRFVRMVQEAGRAGGVEVHNWLYEGHEEEFMPDELVSVHMLSPLQRRIAARVNVLLDEELRRTERSGGPV